MEDSVKIHTENYIKRLKALSKDADKLIKHRELRDLLNTSGSLARRYLASMEWLEEDGPDRPMLNRYFRSRAADSYFKNHLLDIGEAIVFYDNRVSISCDMEEIYLQFESVNDKNRIIKELKLKVDTGY